MSRLVLARRGRQRGVVLVVSLLLLLVLTMLGLAATRGTTLEQRMTTNQNDREVAYQAAEAALRAGESQVSNSAALNYDNNTGGAYNLTTMGDVNWTNIDWSPSGGAVFAYTAGIQPVPIVNPSYFIVFDSTQTASGTGSSLSSSTPVNSNYVYHIYARGVGLTGNTSVILESSYVISTGI